MPDSPTPGAPPPPSRRARRWPWALVPLGLAGAYALVYGLLAYRPSLEAMVPRDAFVTWRFNDLATYDRVRTPPPSPQGEAYAPASVSLGSDLNVPGLPGVAKDRPLLEMWLDPARRYDPRLFVLPVTDAAALKARYADPDLLQRHARYVEVHGAWAAAGWDHEAARRAGTGGGTYPPSLGEDWCVTADWPRLVDYALLPVVAGREPWRSALAALGFLPGSARPTADGQEVAVPGGRVLWVRAAWTRVTLYSFRDRVRLEAVPASEGRLDEALAAALADRGPAEPRLGMPQDAEAWIEFSSAASRRAMALAFGYAGVPWPEKAAANDLAALHLDKPGALTLWAQPSPGVLPTWTLGLAGPPDALPDLAAFGLPDAPVGSAVPLAAGLLAVAAPYGGEAPAGEVARQVDASGRSQVLMLGPGAQAAALRHAQASPHVNLQTGVGPGGPATRVLARFRLAAFPAQRLLGSALEPVGLLAALAGGPVEGEVLTDGARLIVEARRVAR